MAETGIAKNEKIGYDSFISGAAAGCMLRQPIAS